MKMVDKGFHHAIQKTELMFCLIPSSNHSIVVAADDAVISWGPSPTYGELAYGEGESKSSTTAKKVRPLDNIYVHHLTCGMGHSLFIARDDTEEQRAEIAKIPVYTPGPGN